MQYNATTLRDSLRSLAAAKAWGWELHRGAGNPVLTEKYRYYDRNKDVATEIFDYCWCVYEKAFRAGGDQVIGRTSDLKPLKLKVAHIDLQKGQTLLHTATLGNILEMDKWSPVVNDCWILGGVHRRARFRLESPRSFQNLWEASPDRTGLVVTAREILGLMHFGYERVTETGSVTYVSKSPVKALTATVEAYDREIAQHERKGIAAVTQLMGLRDDVAAEIRSFDRSKLRKVTPPR